MRRTMIAAALALWLLLAGIGAAPAADRFSGTYTLKGSKGDIVLTLQPDPDKEGSFKGTMKGGAASWTINAFPVKDAPNRLTGTIQNAGDDAFLSFCDMERQEDRLVLYLIPPDSTGGPDRTRKQPIPFPLSNNAGNSELPGDSQASPAGDTAEEVGHPYAGTFKGDDLTFTSKADGALYTGTIQLNGQSFKFSGRPEGDVLRGVFQTPTDSFDFEASLAGNTLTLKTGDTTYRLQKQGGNNPLAHKPANPLGHKPSNPLASHDSHANSADGNNADQEPTDGGTTAGGHSKTGASGGQAGAPAGWKSYKSPNGLSVSYPPTWTAQDMQGGVELVPPERATDESGPIEAYLVLGTGAAGITSPEDPRMIQQMEQQMAQLAPFMQVSGDPRPVSSGAVRGVMLVWEGVNPRGLQMRAVAYATIVKAYAVGLLAIGKKDRIEARDATVREIFSTFGAHAGSKDPRLVGVWGFYSYKASADGRFGTEKKMKMALRADGTCIRQSSSESSGTADVTNSLGDQIATGGVVGDTRRGDEGTWSAGDGKLYATWNDGTVSTWVYRVVGQPGARHLFLTPGGAGKPDEWTEAGG